ncbi:unnamed protein product [Cylicostephanus goldi]|uniref:Uncharacterized protein n=1 Tax=Cylicostephanus goldi TaxID=71465 RepID=A0A3P6RQ26_CYLGO|nr:unnamed protein product [Cylicostephanus goldi]
MSVADLSWWKYLNWNVTKCTKYDDLNTVSWTTDCNSQSAAVFGSTCWLVIGILGAILLLCLLVFGYAVYAYRQESKTLSYKLKEMEKTLRAQNEFFTAKLHAQMEEQIKLGEKHAEELRKHNEAIQMAQIEIQRQHQLSAVPPVQAAQPQPIIIPYLPSNAGQLKNK